MQTVDINVYYFAEGAKICICMRMYLLLSACCVLAHDVCHLIQISNSSAGSNIQMCITQRVLSLPILCNSAALWSVHRCKPSRSSEINFLSVL